MRYTKGGCCDIIYPYPLWCRSRTFLIVSLGVRLLFYCGRYIITRSALVWRKFLCFFRELNSKTTKTYAKQTNESYPVLKIIPSFSIGNMISFVNRSGRVDIYAYNSDNTIAISTTYVYGKNYEVVSDGSAIYIKVDAATINFVSSLYDCSVSTVQSLPS